MGSNNTSKSRKSALDKKSRYLTLLLRHKPENENLELDEYGSADVGVICEKLDINMEELEYMVDTNNKKRFIFNDDRSKIRCTQGHSFPVKKVLKPLKAEEIPHKLYHGTTRMTAKWIWSSGIKKMNRQDVHLSGDLETATTVGNRRATRKDPLQIIEVNAKLMAFDGYKFYKTENDVWLTEHVPVKYIQ